MAVSSRLMPGARRKFLGLRVTIEGRRAGFNLIDVERIGPATD